MVAGAVYRPDGVTEPTPGREIDHVTALLTAFATVAVSCADWPLLNVTLAGPTLTVTGGAATMGELPLRTMVWTDGEALSVIVIDAV
jgi:hypothetical protein